MRGERRAVTLPASMGLLRWRVKCVSFDQLLWGEVEGRVGEGG